MVIFHLMVLSMCNLQKRFSGAPRARERSPIAKVNLPIAENLVITWPYTDRPRTVRPHHRKTNVYSHILASLGAQEKTNCTSMLWSIDSYQNRAFADQYHLTVPRAQVSTHRGWVFFEVIRWQITSFKWSQAQVYFSKDSYQICCVYVTMAPHY